MTHDEYMEAEWLAYKLGVSIPEPEELQRGGIVGKATITDCVTSSESKWFFGQYGFMLEKAEPLPFHPCKGALGFFEVDYQPEGGEA